MTSLTYNTMTIGEQTYEARRAQLMKSMGTTDLAECARQLARRRTISINGREIVVVFKRNFKALMVK